MSQNYRVAWETDADLKAWIQAVPGEPKKARCKICKCILNAHKKDLICHSKSNKHQGSEKRHLACPSRQITEFMSKTISTERKIAELKIAAFIAEHCSMASADHLGTLLKNIDKSSEVLNNIKLHRTKCTALIVNVLAPCMLKDLLSDISDGKYSLIIDESTAVDSTKMLCVMIKYLSTKRKKIVTKFYKLIQIEAGDANTITTAIVDNLKSDNLKIKNLIGIGVDGANVMIGQHNSVATLLKKYNPELTVVKCVCHSLHLAAEYAFKTLPKN